MPAACKSAGHQIFIARLCVHCVILCQLGTRHCPFEQPCPKCVQRKSQFPKREEKNFSLPLVTLLFYTMLLKEMWGKGVRGEGYGNIGPEKRVLRRQTLTKRKPKKFPSTKHVTGFVVLIRSSLCPVFAPENMSTHCQCMKNETLTFWNHLVSLQGSQWGTWHRFGSRAGFHAEKEGHDSALPSISSMTQKPVKNVLQRIVIEIVLKECQSTLYCSGAERYRLYGSKWMPTCRGMEDEGRGMVPFQMTTGFISVGFSWFFFKRSREIFKETLRRIRME